MNTQGLRRVMEQLDLLAQPRARLSDPPTCALAAEVVKRGNGALIAAIRRYVLIYGPSTSWEIAQGVAGTRWQFDTVRTACARAGLVKLDKWGESPGGRPATLYALAIERADIVGDVL